jgi:hypothetical protein
VRHCFAVTSRVNGQGRDGPRIPDGVPVRTVNLVYDKYQGQTVRRIVRQTWVYSLFGDNSVTSRLCSRCHPRRPHFLPCHLARNWHVDQATVITSTALSWLSHYKILGRQWQSASRTRCHHLFRYCHRFVVMWPVGCWE